MTPETTPSIRCFLQKTCRLSDQDLILAGVSGGADSLYLLAHLKAAGFPVMGAIFNHGLRQEAAAEVAAVRKICAEWDVPLLEGSADVQSFAASQKRSIEEAARICRYRFLFSAAEKQGASAVAVGHHLDDQAETVLMHFLRGSGVRGLSGMTPCQLPSEWSEKIPLIRPLLGTRRKTIEAWCRDNDILPVVDPSNFDASFLRNRLRNELLPQLATAYNPQIIETLSRNARVLQADWQLLESVIADAWEKAAVRELVTSQQIVFKRNEFMEFPEALQSHLLRRALFQLRPDSRDFGFESVSQGLAFWRDAPNFGCLPFAEKIKLHKFPERLLLTHHDIVPNPDRRPQLPADFQEKRLPKQGVLRFPGWGLTIRTFSAEPDERKRMVAAASEDNQVCLIDADKICGQLMLRTMRQGERWRPFGMGGKSQKLSDFWINLKIPQALRGNFPLIADGSEIVWVPGMRSADFCAVSEQTTNLIRLGLEENDSPPADI